MGNRVLLVEDSLSGQLVVRSALDGVAELTVAPDLKSAWECLKTDEFRLILLDVNLPDGSGFNFCSSLAADRGARRPRVLFLTGSRDIGEKLTGFSVGGDDYVTKPFEPMELKARVMAQLRTLEEMSDAKQTIRVGDVELDLAQHSVEALIPGGPVRIELTPTEFRLLAALARREGRILSREQLLSSLVAQGEHALDRTIDAHLSKLRKKVGAFGLNVEAVYGIGYRLVRGSPA
jgi:DNA-binding response OmpR family regulator